MELPENYHVHLGEALGFLRTLPDDSIDAVVTDPPYSSGGTHMTARTQQDTRMKYAVNFARKDLSNFTGDNRDQRSWTYWCTLWLIECVRVAKPSSPIVVFTDWRQLPATTDYLQAAGVTWRGVFPWCKPASRPSGPGRFRNGAEFIVWGSKGDMPPRQDVGFLPGYHIESIRRHDKHHLTGKPTQLMREVVRICPPGGIVLDPFAGSGTTGVAAILEGRGFVGAETNRVNVAIATQRMAAALAQREVESAR